MNCLTLGIKIKTQVYFSCIVFYLEIYQTMVINFNLVMEYSFKIQELNLFLKQESDENYSSLLRGKNNFIHRLETCYEFSKNSPKSCSVAEGEEMMIDEHREHDFRPK